MTNIDQDLDQAGIIESTLNSITEQLQGEEWTNVSSSNIERVGYDRSQGNLLVQFKGGAVYSYDGGSRILYDALRTASSVGSYFHQHVKAAGLPYRRVYG